MRTSWTPGLDEKFYGKHWKTFGIWRKPEEAHVMRFAHKFHINYSFCEFPLNSKDFHDLPSNFNGNIGIHLILRIIYAQYF